MRPPAAARASDQPVSQSPGPETYESPPRQRRKVAIRNALGLPPDLAADPMLARRRARGDMEVWVPVWVGEHIYIYYTYGRMVDVRVPVNRLTS